jgi:hypothetical protein
VDVLREAREREPQLLDARDRQPARLGPARARDHAQLKLRRGLCQKLGDGD